jgi:hypothetical protein
MPKLSGSLDAYEVLAEGAQGSWVRCSLAFAVIEEQKFEWMKHLEEHAGRVATDDEIRSWYEALPAGAIERARRMADIALEAYAEDLESTFAEAVRKQVEESALIGELRQGRRFWPQFGANVAAGLTSSVLFGGLLFVIAFLVLNERSPVEIGASLRSSFSKEISNARPSHHP